MPPKCFQEIKEEGTLPNPFLSGQYKPDAKNRYYQKVKLDIDTKMSSKLLANRFSSILKALFSITRWDLFLECKDGSTYKKESM